MRWTTALEYDGRRGWEGWYTHQRMLYEKLLSWTARAQRLWVLDDQHRRYRRLDRLELEHEDGLAVSGSTGSNGSGTRTITV